MTVRLLLASLFASMVFAGDPVPGVDVSLEQIPGGTVRTVQTDSKGAFVFDNLPMGKYVLTIKPKSASPKDAASLATNLNSSRSNIYKTYAPAPAGKTNMTFLKIEIRLLTTGPTGPTELDELISLRIGPGGGRVFGTVEKVTSPTQ